MSAIVGAGTIAVSVVAWRTSKRATEIADQQRNDSRELREATALIVGRLLCVEVTTMPIRISNMLEAWKQVKGIEVSDKRVLDGRALEYAIDEALRPLLPGAEMVEERIHNLPGDLGADLAAVIGHSRALNDMAARVQAKLGKIQGPDGAVQLFYSGIIADFDHIIGHLASTLGDSIVFANEFRVFAGREPNDYSELLSKKE